VAVPVDTGVERSLPDTPYADRRRALESGLSWWRSSPGDAAARLAALPEAVRGVVRHALTEARRVRDGADALRRGDAAALGRLMDEGHVSLSRDFGASTPEIDALAASVRAREGVLGVRLQGAGWGGCLAVLRKRAAHASGDGATE
jgi:galactokinase